MIETDFSSTDICAWKCTNSQCRKYRSIKNGSVFEKSKYNWRQCFRIHSVLVANFWPMDIAQCIFFQDTHVICRFCRIFKEKASQKYLDDIHENPLGSTGEIVQID